MQTKNTIGTRTNTYTDERRKSSARVVTPRNEQTGMMIVLSLRDRQCPPFIPKSPLRSRGLTMVFRAHITLNGDSLAWNYLWVGEMTQCSGSLVLG